MKKNYTDLNILLDGSGSMELFKEDVIGGITKLINEQKEVEGNCTLTLVQFDYSPFYENAFNGNILPNVNAPIVNIINYPNGTATSTKYIQNSSFTGNQRNGYQVVYDAVDIKKVETSLIAKSYCPRGNTAYLDAIGKLIDDTGERLRKLSEDERPEKVVVVIYTDGMENASVKFSRKDIGKKIKHQTEVYNWEFTFLGANFDVLAESQSLGIQSAAALNYSQDANGISKGFSVLSENLRSYRAGLSANISYSDEDRELVK
ncbi:MAG TPA: hypothetical protein PLP33_27115 [Leptospiraceae bacterium]|nr:hypothetical protein [Leptospiraceae bacterium]